MITTTDRVSLLGICKFTNTASSLLEIPVAAEALLKNPANVITICIVERKREGSFKSSRTWAAFLLPSSAFCDNLLGLADTSAISAPAKKAFNAVRNTSNSNCSHKLSGSESIEIKPPKIKKIKIYITFSILAHIFTLLKKILIFLEFVVFYTARRYNIGKIVNESRPCAGQRKISYNNIRR